MSEALALEALFPRRGRDARNPLHLSDLQPLHVPTLLQQAGFTEPLRQVRQIYESETQGVVAFVTAVTQQHQVVVIFAEAHFAVGRQERLQWRVVLGVPLDARIH